MALGSSSLTVLAVCSQASAKSCALKRRQGAAPMSECDRADHEGSGDPAQNLGKLLKEELSGTCLPAATPAPPRRLPDEVPLDAPRVFIKRFRASRCPERFCTDSGQQNRNHLRFWYARHGC